MMKLRGNAHRLREIEMADPQHVHAGSSGDGFRIVHAARRLDHGDHGSVLVGLAKIGSRIGHDVVRVSGTQTDAAMTHGRILHGADDFTRLLGRLDIGNHDAERARVHGARKEMI